MTTLRTHVVLPADALPRRGQPLQVTVTAPPAGSALPVVVFSHGYGAFGASMHTYRPLADHWAGSGFAVVQVNHLDAEGVGSDDPRSTELWRTRIEDVTAVIDRLDQIAAQVAGLAARLDRDRIAVAGHSYGATTVSALAGARVIGDGEPPRSYRHPQVRAAVLIALTGTGESLTDFAREHFAFMDPDFAELDVPSLVIAGDADQSRLSHRGPDWFTDGYRLAPGATDLVRIVGGEHSLGGINGDDGHVTDASADRVAVVQQTSTAYLRTRLGLDADAWPEACRELDASFGRIESAQVPA